MKTVHKNCLNKNWDGKKEKALFAQGKHPLKLMKGQTFTLEIPVKVITTLERKVQCAVRAYTYDPQVVLNCQSNTHVLLLDQGPSVAWGQGSSSGTWHDKAFTVDGLTNRGAARKVQALHKRRQSAEDKWETLSAAIKVDVTGTFTLELNASDSWDETEADNPHQVKFVLAAGDSESQAESPVQEFYIDRTAPIIDWVTPQNDQPIQLKSARDIPEIDWLIRVRELGRQTGLSTTALCARRGCRRTHRSMIGVRWARRSSPQSLKRISDTNPIRPPTLTVEPARVLGAEMNKELVHALNTAKRDALVSYYLGQVIANVDTLKQQVRTAEDLYDYLLIDPLVGSQVMTSELGEAIASTQQYINRVVQGREPRVVASAMEVARWQDGENRYAVWAGLQQLRAYPENYIDPPLRVSKTELFKALESRLSQGRINNDLVQEAILDYLNGFEEISNLQIIACYEDGLKPLVDTFYFIGRTKMSPYQYYWRSLNMRRRYKDDQLYPTAWSEWKKIETSLDGAIPSTVRPVFMNGRLYVAWCESREEKDEKGSVSRVEVTFKLAHKRFNDSWSEPHNVYNREIEKDQEPDHLIAVVDGTSGIEYLCLYAVAKGQSEQKLRFICDPLMNIIDGGSGEESATLKELYTSFSAPDVVQHPYKEGVYQVVVGAREDIVRVGANQNTEIVFNVKIDGDKLAFTSEVSPGCFPEGFERVLGQDPKLQHVFEIQGQDILKEQAKQVSDFQHHGSRQYSQVALSKLLSEQDVRTLWIRHGMEFQLDGRQRGCWAKDVITLTKTQNLHQTRVHTDGKTGAQFLTLHGSMKEAKKPESRESLHSPLRLNTLFAKSLIKQANAGVERVLTETQWISEPAFKANDAEVPIDFAGANSLYFWELFFHTPFLVAHRLNVEQRFDEATHWLHFLFYPAAERGEYWKVRPLQGLNAGAPTPLADDGETDPDALAMVAPVRYQKAVFFKYLKNLMDRGDACYRELSRDGLAQAKQWYKLALTLIGDRPQVKLVRRWEPVRLDEGMKQNQAARRQGAIEKSVKGVTGIFTLPINHTLNEYWTDLETRLYNLRHSLTLDGKPLSLPLFNKPRNPSELLAARAAGAVQSGGGQGGPLQVPPYRYSQMINKAYAAVETLMQFGSTLLLALERKDGAQLERLQHLQQGELLAFTLDMQLQSIKMGDANKAMLEYSKSAAEARLKHYDELLKEGLSDLEVAALGVRGGAMVAAHAGNALRIAGGFADLAPNVFGFSNGGMRYSSPMQAAGEAVLSIADAAMQSALMMETTEQYRRRAQEWAIAAQPGRDRGAPGHGANRAGGGTRSAIANAIGAAAHAATAQSRAAGFSLHALQQRAALPMDGEQAGPVVLSGLRRRDVVMPGDRGGLAI